MFTTINKETIKPIHFQIEPFFLFLDVSHNDYASHSTRTLDTNESRDNTRTVSSITTPRATVICRVDELTSQNLQARVVVNGETNPNSNNNRTLNSTLAEVNQNAYSNMNYPHIHHDTAENYHQLNAAGYGGLFTSAEKSPLYAANSNSYYAASAATTPMYHSATNVVHPNSFYPLVYANEIPRQTHGW